MIENIKLSFCIPTYNNAKSINRLVMSILSYKDPEIEIVVLNNGSTDETLSLLQKINDERLNLFSNDMNMGALFNMVNVLDKGRGEYLVYMTDHDHIDNENIDEFKSFLLTADSVSCGYCEFVSSSEKQFDIYTKGFQAANKIAYITRHPTGYFFKNDFLKSLNFVNRFSDYEYVDLFPLEFVFAELCVLGDGAIYHDPLFSPETEEKIVVKHKSATTNGKSKNAFFSPQTRLKLAISFEDHIHSLSLNENDKEELKINSFFRELSSATLGFKNIMNRKDLCEHYYMECRKIRIKELFDIGFHFYRGYSKRVINIRFKSFPQQVIFKIHLFSILFRKIGRRIVRI